MWYSRHIILEVTQRHSRGCAPSSPKAFIGNPGLTYLERKRKSLSSTGCFKHGSPIEALGDDVVVALGDDVVVALEKYYTFYCRVNIPFF